MYYSGNFYLTLSQMQVNAQYIYNYLIVRGWTSNSICGMLGNMQSESTINPDLWESFDIGNMELGYGLVQWTPAPKYLDWCSARGLNPALMESNLDRIQYEIDNGLQWIPTSQYNYSFQTFKESLDSPYDLGIAFLRNYERPKEINQTNRGTQAMYWYEYLTGEIPQNPNPNPTPINSKKMPLYFYLKPY